jgi:hypothetical protein
MLVVGHVDTERPGVGGRGHRDGGRGELLRETRGVSGSDVGPPHAVHDRRWFFHDLWRRGYRRRCRGTSWRRRGENLAGGGRCRLSGRGRREFLPRATAGADQHGVNTAKRGQRDRGRHDANPTPAELSAHEVPVTSGREAANAGLDKLHVRLRNLTTVTTTRKNRERMINTVRTRICGGVSRLSQPPANAAPTALQTEVSGCAGTEFGARTPAVPILRR